MLIPIVRKVGNIVTRDDLQTQLLMVLKLGSILEELMLKFLLVDSTSAEKVIRWWLQEGEKFRSRRDVGSRSCQAKYDLDLIKVLEGAIQRVPPQIHHIVSRGGIMGRTGWQWVN